MAGLLTKLFGFEGPYSAELRRQEETHQAVMQETDLNKKIKVARELGGMDTEAGRRYLIDNVAPSLQGMPTTAFQSQKNIPYGVAPEKAAGLNNASVDDTVAGLKDNEQVRSYNQQTRQNDLTSQDLGIQRDRTALEAANFGLAEAKTAAETSRQNLQIELQKNQTELEAAQERLELLRNPRKNEDDLSRRAREAEVKQLEQQAAWYEQRAAQIQNEQAGISDETRRIDRVAQLLDLQATNVNKVTGESLSPAAAGFLEQQIGDATGIQGMPIEPAEGSKKISLAEMIGGYPQEEKRSWFDDTHSSQSVRQAANNYVDLLVGEGMDEQDARKKATSEYGQLIAKDNGMFQKYPKMDLADLFVAQDARKGAIENGDAVVDNGDGQQTVPVSYREMGITDPAMMEEFESLEAMVGKSLPELNLRQDYQRDPQFYSMLMRVIREGVPDRQNGGMRKLSVQEIIDFIMEQ